MLAFSTAPTLESTMGSQRLLCRVNTRVHIFLSERGQRLYLLPVLMAKFLKEIGLFLLILLGVFLALEVPIQVNYDTQISERADWQCLDSINADILVVGNSRVEGGFDPMAIEEGTGYVTYLLTQSGWQAPVLRQKLENYLLVNEPPTWLVIQADPIHLKARKDWYAKSQFLKYCLLYTSDAADE